MKFTLNDSWIDDLVALGAYLFLILAVFIKHGWSLIPIMVGIAIVTALLISRLIYVIARKGNGRGRSVTWRSLIVAALYCVLLTVILGCDFSAVWVLWGLAIVFTAGSIILVFVKK
jgi:hypothetical protein